MKKIVLIGIVAIIILLSIFLYPKDAGSTCGLCPARSYQKIEYGCLGFKYEYKQQCLGCGTEFKCMGIVTQKKCYSLNSEQPTSWTEVSCS